MPHRLVLTEDAVADLTRIYDWILEATGDDPLASACVDRLRSRCAALIDFPGIGTPRSGDLRSFAVDRRATILYEATDEVVRIVGVFHRGRALLA